MKNEYLILLIVIIVGLIAIFSLTFLMAGNQEDLTGAWGGRNSCDCGGNSKCTECCQEKNCNSARAICEGCFGTFKKAV